MNVRILFVKRYFVTEFAKSFLISFPLGMGGFIAHQQGVGILTIFAAGFLLGILGSAMREILKK